MLSGGEVSVRKKIAIIHCPFTQKYYAVDEPDSALPSNIGISHFLPRILGS